ASGARLVHISSVAVYGGTAAYPVSREWRGEDHPFQPIPESDFYGRSKRMAEAVVRQAGERREVDAIALRPNVIYGERDRLFTPRVIRVLRLPLGPRSRAPSPGSWQTKSPGTSPGHRHYTERELPTASSSSPPAWLRAWRPERPSSSPCRPSSCAWKYPPSASASSTCRCSSASCCGRCRRRPRQASARPFDTRPSPPRRGPLRDASCVLLIESS